MPTITAQDILDENNYTESDISKAKVEALIDNAINYINLETGLSISNMSGSSGSKSVTVTSGQAPIVKALASLYVRAYVDHGPEAAVGGMNVNVVNDDPQLALLRSIVDRGIMLLRSRSFART